MATKKSTWVLFGILVISAWVLGSAIQAGAETLNYKFYSWVKKAETVAIADAEGHIVNLTVREAFVVFENGELGIGTYVSTSDFTKGAGPFMQYATITFADRSTIIRKDQGTFGGGASTYTSEIIKGTGRFEGIKGTSSSTGKNFPASKEGPSRAFTDLTLTYTLPTK